MTTVGGVTLRHYASDAVELDRSRVYEQGIDPNKPVGLWLSVAGEDDWPSWCRGEQWGLESLEVEHRVTLDPGARILAIEESRDFDTFNAAYLYPLYPNERKPSAINWRAVAATYDGIIIAPYCWQRRLSLSWYYGWDCASGCVWNLGAIADFAPAMAEVAS